MAKCHDTTYRKQSSPAHFHKTVVCLNRLFEIAGSNVNNSSSSMKGNDFLQVDQGPRGNSTRPMCRWWAVIDKSCHALEAGIPVSLLRLRMRQGVNWWFANSGGARVVLVLTMNRKSGTIYLGKWQLALTGMHVYEI